MQSLVLTVHILACVALIVLVLLQSGKEGMGVIFGGGSQSFFGSAGAGGLLVKVTAGLVAVFLATSLSYNLLLKQESLGGGSLMEDGALAPLIDEAPEAAPNPGVTFEDAPATEGDQ